MKYEDDKLCIDSFEKMAQAYYKELDIPNSILYEPAEEIFLNKDFEDILYILSKIYNRTCALKKRFYYQHKIKEFNLLQQTLTDIKKCISKEKCIDFKYEKINISFQKCKNDLIALCIDFIEKINCNCCHSFDCYENKSDLIQKVLNLLKIYILL